jgi:hypothetical protein
MIITTLNVLRKNNGGTERVFNLISHFKIHEVTIITFLKNKVIFKDGIKYNYVGLSFHDFFYFFYLVLFTKVPYSACLYQREGIVFSNDLNVFHLIRSFQVRRELQIFSNSGKFVFDYCESHSDNLSKRLNNIPNLLAVLFNKEIKRINFFENHLLSNFKTVYFITKNDKKFISSMHYVLPNKIFKKFVNETYTNRNLKKLIFLGDMTYFPNILALKWIDRFLSNQDFIVHVIGRIEKEIKVINPDKIIFYGYVENFDDIIKDSIGAVFFSKESTGLQNKILVYLNYGIPVFTNSEVADSFEANYPFLIINDYANLELELNLLVNSKFKFDRIVLDGFAYLEKYYLK